MSTVHPHLQPKNKNSGNIVLSPEYTNYLLSLDTKTPKPWDPKKRERGNNSRNNKPVPPEVEQNNILEEMGLPTSFGPAKKKKKKPTVSPY